MRAVLLGVLLSIAVARISQPDKTIRPLTVDSLTDLTGARSAAPPSGEERAPRVALSDLQVIQTRMKEQSETLKTLQKQLDEGLKQKRRLELTQRLMTALATLNRANRAVKNIGEKVTAAKATIKRLQDTQNEIADAQRRADAERAREPREQDARLIELKEQSQKESGEITKLEAKLKAVKSAVSKWKEYVSQVRRGA